MRFSRTSKALGMVAIAALALTGCGAGGAGCRRWPATLPATRAIITANGIEPQNPLIPTNTNEVGGGKILDAIFAGLVYYDAKGAPVNDMAESIESDDAQNYTIKIKADQKFTNGEPVTAESFVKAWNYGAALDNAQLSSYFFESIKGFSYDENVDRELERPQGRRRHDVHRRAEPAGVRLPAAPRLLGVLPAARGSVGGHRGVR